MLFSIFFSEIEDIIKRAQKFTFRCIGKEIVNDDLNPLISYIKHGDEDEALERIRNHPSDVKKKNSTDSTPLHYACIHTGSIDLVQVLLQGYPAAATAQNKFGATPLHLACCNGASFEVIKSISNASHSKAASIRNMYGHTPFRASCRENAPYEVLELLLKCDPSLIHVMDQWGKSPISELWSCYEDANLSSPRTKKKNRIDFPFLWEKICLLLRVSYKGAEGIDRNIEINLVHAAIDSGTNCPVTLFKHILNVHANQVDGMAIHMALEKGVQWESGIQKMFQTAPDFIDTPNKNTGLLPFMQAAVGSKSSVNTIFSLLLEQPNLVSCGIKDMASSHDAPKPLEREKLSF